MSWLILITANAHLAPARSPLMWCACVSLLLSVLVRVAFFYYFLNFSDTISIQTHKSGSFPFHLLKRLYTTCFQSLYKHTQYGKINPWIIKTRRSRRKTLRKLFIQHCSRRVSGIRRGERRCVARGTPGMPPIRKTNYDEEERIRHTWHAPKWYSSNLIWILLITMQHNNNNTAERRRVSELNWAINVKLTNL